jgi:hydroxymethylpyrimidine pyrophosphatase-like HAD family hydrolase
MRAASLVATDLDGTLWGPDGRAHPRTVDAVVALREAGIPVLAVTGRRPATALRQLAANGIDMSAAIFLDGSLGWELPGGAVIVRRAFARNDAIRILEIFRTRGGEPCVVVGPRGQDLLVGDRPVTHPDHLRASASAVQRCDLGRAVTERAVLSFLACGVARRQLEPLIPELARVGEVSLTSDRVYGGCAISVRARDATKWAAVSAYCARTGLSPAGVVAVGNDDNDLDLLASAAVACVPAGGSAAAIALATRVIPPPGEGGWAELADLASWATSGGSR